ncbi:GrpB family protein [Pseudodesulfovibrio portus]|uniref:GrpB family protein n=1 Tax=Pseudodesulfovibrio portus TaxID=231439 RepID=A0ABN6RTP0_9BACT|nr:GrpB family protein [Pseudodesulfovibrio portus]BDQ34451.1 hypothetical protein JCM14722_19930 [Pseudodesulfovibrio portus]
METLEEKIERVLRDRVELAPYDPTWLARFEEEKAHLLSCLSDRLVTRVEHYGSTAVPGMTAKPVVDMLVEVASHEWADECVPSILQPPTYDYFRRPLDDGHYPWLIKRNAAGRRTHHIHMAEKDSRLWEGLAFRDHLRAHPDDAEAYRELKLRLAERHPGDRIAYTEGKTDFVNAILAKAGR